MPIDFDQLRKRGILTELARVFGDATSAGALLLEVTYPNGRIPAFTTGNAFWMHVCQEIASGLTAGGLEALLAAAAELYPHNPTFAPWRRPDSALGQRQTTGASIHVYGVSDPSILLGAARATAHHAGIRPPVELGISSINVIELRLPSATTGQATSLAEALANQGLGEHFAYTVNSPNIRDYLIGRIYIEGPDQSRYAIHNTPASTRIGDVARAAVEEFQGGGHPGADQGPWPTDGSGQPRVATVDRVLPNGSSERLDPDRTLHECQVGEDTTLSVNPQTTAGVNPVLRQGALVRARQQVVAFAHSHPGFRVRANSDLAPTEYILEFEAESLAPPVDDPRNDSALAPLAPGGIGGGIGSGSDGGTRQPIPRRHHQVLLALPADFPMLAPAAFWQTPIFHPNIHQETGKVCLGALEERYRPGLDFGRLCQMLIDMATYRNYALVDGYYNREAAEWVLSTDGQREIERLGGQSLIGKLVRDLIGERKPRGFRVQRLEP